MKTEVEVRETLDRIMEQYQRAGSVMVRDDLTLEQEIWCLSILDKCSVAIQALSFVLGEGDCGGNLTGECCDPAVPYKHEDPELEAEIKEGYRLYIESITRKVQEKL